MPDPTGEHPGPTTRLLHRARSAPREGFAALHARMADPLLLWANLHVLPPLRRRLPPEDFVQEVWARAYAGFAGYDHARTDFRAWVFGIAYNVLRENLRSLSRRGRREVDGADLPEPVDPRSTAGTRTARRERGQRLLAHAEQLGDDERRLLIWRGIEGLPFAEVGARLGIGAVAADSRWRRLQARLRASFPGWLDES
ncbi:MAG: RNA polymerase sigma factor [Planctomycetota bacterium]